MSVSTSLHFPCRTAPYSPRLCSARGCPFASRLPVVSGQQKANRKTWRNRGERLGSLPRSSCFWAILHQQGHWWWRLPCGSSGRWVLQGAGDTPSTSGARGKHPGLRLLLSGPPSIIQSAVQVLLLPLRIVSPPRLPCWNHLRELCFLLGPWLTYRLNCFHQL